MSGQVSLQARLKEACADIEEMSVQQNMLVMALVRYQQAGIGNSTDFHIQAEANNLANAAFRRISESLP